MIDELVANAKAAAGNVEHIWDEKAIDWPLDSESVVVEVGGYTGRWALQIAERYHPRLFVFEPQPWAFEVCLMALGHEALVLNFGLGDHDGTMQMGDWGTDGCSIVKPMSGDASPARVCEIGRIFREIPIEHIDLMLMNIEGYEYTLLPHMLDQNILPQRLMVQFHDHADLDGSKRATIAQRLDGLGYRVVWEYWALTAWERR